MLNDTYFGHTGESALSLSNVGSLLIASYSPYVCVPKQFLMGKM